MGVAESGSKCKNLTKILKIFIYIFRHFFVMKKKRKLLIFNKMPRNVNPKIKFLKIKKKSLKKFPKKLLIHRRHLDPDLEEIIIESRVVER
jgi:hypothetical protein